jgi:hypothetical protein
MLVTLTIDRTQPRDIAMCDEIRGWLHFSSLRGGWSMIETKNDDDGADRARSSANGAAGYGANGRASHGGENGEVEMVFSFVHPLDAYDFCRWRGLAGRGTVR